VDNEDGDYQFNFQMGLAGGDPTTFTEYCYNIIEETEVTYHYALGPGCPAHILKYYDGFLLGLYANYYSDDPYDTYANNTTLYGTDEYEFFYICPGDSMDCMSLFMYSALPALPPKLRADGGLMQDAPSSYAILQAGIARINTFEFTDDGDFDEVYTFEWLYELSYPNYGFSSTQFGSVMNINEDGAGDDSYWFNENAGLGLMHFHRFLAVNDERLDIGDTLTVWSIYTASDTVMSTSLELASGVSLAASAAAVLASATLL